MYHDKSKVSKNLCVLFFRDKMKIHKESRVNDIFEPNSVTIIENKDSDLILVTVVSVSVKNVSIIRNYV